MRNCKDCDYNKICPKSKHIENYHLANGCSDFKNDYEMKFMNNKTVKKVDVVIKLKEDNVYDLYLDGKWIASRGSCENILDEARSAIKDSFLNN